MFLLSYWGTKLPNFCFTCKFLFYNSLIYTDFLTIPPLYSDSARPVRVVCSLTTRHDPSRSYCSRYSSPSTSYFPNKTRQRHQLKNMKSHFGRADKLHRKTKLPKFKTQMIYIFRKSNLRSGNNQISDLQK